MPTKKTPNRTKKKPSTTNTTKNKYQSKFDAQRRNREISGIILIACGIFFFLTRNSFKDQSAGGITIWLTNIVFGLLGFGAYILPFALIAYGIYTIALSEKRNFSKNSLFAALFCISALCVGHLNVYNQVVSEAGSYISFIQNSFIIGKDSAVGMGLIGSIATFPAVKIFGMIGSYVLFVTLALIQFIILTNMSVQKTSKRVGKSIKTKIDQIKIREQERAQEKQNFRQAKQEFYDFQDPQGEDDFGAAKPKTPARKTVLKAAPSDFDFDVSENFEKKAQKPTEQDENKQPVLNQQKKKIDWSNLFPFNGFGKKKTTATSINLGSVESGNDFVAPVDPFRPYGIQANETQQNQFFEQEQVFENQQSFSPINEPDFDSIREPGFFPQNEHDELDYPLENMALKNYEKFLPKNVKNIEPQNEYQDFSNEEDFIEYQDFNQEQSFDQHHRDEQDQSFDQHHRDEQDQSFDQHRSAEQEQSKRQKNDLLSDQNFAEFSQNEQKQIEIKEYIPPSVELLNRPVQPTAKQEDTKKKAVLLEDTLKSFGILARVINVTQGPVITRYELQPAPGVRVNRITNLADDIALNLAAPTVRIEAPIPGKAAIGIEIPNKIVAGVSLREIIHSPDFQNNKSFTAVALGKDISGKIVLADIAKMPHLLIAGSTGSGKSVCINCIICSFLYHATPEDVKLIMVDPKVVELAAFSKIPHLLIPVVTDPKEAANALKWVVKEMIDRYQSFASCGARDLARYNEVMTAKGANKTPKIVIIIDELADLMMVASDEVEDAICRVAQMGRAAGIHLIVATQRPSSDVITGIIKANIPSRIAFAVASAIDSRIILDTGGAEKLLGKGDMLFSPIGSSQAMRIQGALVTDGEIEKIKEHFESIGNQQQFSESAQEGIEKATVDAKKLEEKDDQDVLLAESVELLMQVGQASISMLQRRKKIGYSRAARLIDTMELMGIVSASEGTKTRKILISRTEFETIFGYPPNIPNLGI